MEARRVALLHDYRVLDTPPVAALDRLCQIASLLLDIPIALISLVDSDRQWFKARVGLDAQETPRDMAFCAHAIMQEGMFLVEDAAADPRFAQNPLVTGNPDIRFYAGVPLTVEEGMRLGTLCVIDRRPRHLSDDHRAVLEELAQLATAELKRAALERQMKLELRRTAKRAAKLKRYMQRSSFVSQLANVGWWEYAPGSDRVDWSREVYRIHEVDSTYDLTPTALLAFHPPSVRDAVADAHRAAAAGGGPIHYEQPIVTGAGNARWVKVVGEAFVANGDVVRVAGAISDITDLKNAEASAQHLATHDALTGIPNRALFNIRLGEAVRAAASAGTEMAVLLLDLDYLKDVNDSLGHDAGDALIREMATRLQACAAPGHCVARLGGDEFGIIVPDAARVGAVEALVGCIDSALAAPWRFGRYERSLSVSIGIARAPVSPGDEAGIYKNADVALYQAKADGRGRHCYFRKELRAARDLDRKLMDAVAAGLSAGEFRVFYQPVVSLRSGRLAGLEALLRWQHPVDGLLSPAAFEPALADARLAPRIAAYVLDEVLARIKGWEGQGVTLGRVSLNLGVHDLRSEDSARLLLDRVAQSGVAPASLAVEVTEHVVIGRSSDRVGAALRTLRDAGIQIALDDFGTGYASLVHLADLSADILKIDRSFISEIGAKETSRNIVGAVVDLAHRLGKQVVAEGVETPEQLRLLREFGCDMAQGFYFSPPIPAGAVARYAADNVTPRRFG
jgi:diguanylate cyclase (GGDEF)-like protein